MAARVVIVIPPKMASDSSVTAGSGNTASGELSVVIGGAHNVAQPSGHLARLEQELTRVALPDPRPLHRLAKVPAIG